LLSGILFNTPNNATQYKTGNEFHLDFMLNQFLSVRDFTYEYLVDDLARILEQY